MVKTSGMFRRRARKGGVKSLAKGKSTAITKLARSIQGIQRRIKGDTEYLQLGLHASRKNLTAPYFSVNLNDFSSMDKIFGTTANDVTGNKVSRRSMGVDVYVSMENLVNNEEETTNFTAYLVSLRDAIDTTQVINPANGQLQLQGNGTHYYDVGVVPGGGYALLNKKYFKIHKSKRFTLTNHGTDLAQPSAQSQYGTDMRFYWKTAPRQIISSLNGDWGNLRYVADPSKNYYLIIFNDNSALDSEWPEVSYNSIQTFTKLS